jgi:hypothetical protein
VLAIAGLLDVPLVVLAAHWFRGIHPTSPEMEPSMRIVLLATLASFSAVFAHLLMRRRAQLVLEEQLALWEGVAGDDGGCNPGAGRDR